MNAGAPESRGVADVVQPGRVNQGRPPNLVEKTAGDDRLAGDGLGVGEASTNINKQPSSLLSSGHHADLTGHGGSRLQPSAHSFRKHGDLGYASVLLSKQGQGASNLTGQYYTLGAT